MINPDVQLTDIRKALDRLKEGGSSDFDLNPGVMAQLPSQRKLRDAAVLLPLIARPSGLHLVLTKRASHLKHHPGQIALPGGKVDTSDTDVVAAATREAFEEIGLPPQSVSVIGTMAIHETITGFNITPVLGEITSNFVPRPEKGEVDEIFEVPLAHVANPANYQNQGRVWQGVHRRYPTVPYGPYYIWGATARILRVLADGVSG